MLRSVSDIGKLLALLLTFSSDQLIAQSKFTIEPELGVNSSMFPKTIEFTTSGSDEVKERYMPIVSPLIGVWTSLYKKHFYVSFGIQFNKSGERNYVTRVDYDHLNSQYVTSNSKEVFSFNKISVPIILGYQYRIERFTGTVFLGLKQKSYTKGNYYFNFEYPTPGVSYQKNINPFDYANLQVGAKESGLDYMAGIGSVFKKKIYVTLSIALGTYVFFQEITPSNWDGTGYDHRYQRGDFALTVRYLLIVSKSK